MEQAAASKSPRPKLKQTSLSSPPAKKPKTAKQYARDNSSRTEMRAEWLKLFPWLEVEQRDSQDGHRQDLFFCRLCLSTKRINVFTSGKNAEKKRKTISRNLKKQKITCEFD